MAIWQFTFYLVPREAVEQLMARQPLRWQGFA